MTDGIDYSEYDEGRYCNYWHLDRTLQRELERVTDDEEFVEGGHPWEVRNGGGLPFRLDRPTEPGSDRTDVACDVAEAPSPRPTGNPADEPTPDGTRT